MSHDEELEAKELLEKYKPLSAGDLATARLKPPPWIITDLLRERSLTLITGETYTGKTMFAMNIAVSIDTGVPVLGHHAYRPKGSHRVIFFGQDGPTWDYAQQYLKLWRGSGVPVTERYPRSLFFLNRGANLLDDGFYSLLGRFNDVLKTDVLVLDTLLELHDKNENLSYEMKPVLGQLKRIRDKLGYTVIMVHHESKGDGMPLRGKNNKPRGSGLIVQSSDEHINLSLKRKNVIKLALPKARGADDEVEPPEQFEIVSVPHPEGKALKLVASLPTASRVTKILEFLGQERTRKEVGEFIRAQEPLLDTADAFKHADRILDYLVYHKKIARVRHGVYKRIQ